MRDNDNRFWPGCCGLEAWESRWVSRQQVAHWHDAFQVSVTVGGGGAVETPCGTLLLPEGTGVVLPPGVVHRLRPVGGEGWHFRTIFFPRESAGHGPTHESPPVRLSRVASHQVFDRLFGQIAAEADRAGQLDALGRLTAVTLSDDHPVAAGSESKQPAWLSAVREYLDRTPDRNLKLADLAERAGVGECHLVRTFGREFGMSPYAYHVQSRVNHARSLLRDGRAPAEVAADLGFADQSHLTRHFRRLVGTPPGKYSRKSRSFKTDHR